MKKKRILLAIIGCIGILAIAITVTVVNEHKMVTNGLRIARVAINPKAVAYVNSLVVSDPSIRHKPEYLELANTLEAISKAFPVDAKWTYIATKGNSVDDARLSVLTIKYNKDDVSTYPGFIYDISKYPAMQKAIYGDEDIVISTVVWDDIYKFITRSGFAKIYDGDTVVGVLCVDLTTWQLLKSVWSMLMLTITYSASFLLVLSFVLGPKYFLSVHEIKYMQRHKC